MNVQLPATSVSLRQLDQGSLASVVALELRNRLELESTGPTRPDSAYSEAALQERVERLLQECGRGTRQYWTIHVDDDLAGHVGLNRMERGAMQTANVGYLVDAPFRGRGVATTALRVAVARCFGEMRLHRLDAGVLTTNAASQRVLDKVGFRRVGLLERNFYVAGRWRDHFLYEILAPDFVPDLA